MDLHYNTEEAYDMNKLKAYKDVIELRKKIAKKKLFLSKNPLRDPYESALEIQNLERELAELLEFIKPKLVVWQRRTNSKLLFSPPSHYVLLTHTLIKL